MCEQKQTLYKYTLKKGSLMAVVKGLQVCTDGKKEQKCNACLNKWYNFKSSNFIKHAWTLCTVLTTQKVKKYTLMSLGSDGNNQSNQVTF